MHHPIVISNKKHRGIASRMWGIQWSDQVLAEMMAPGADLVLTGHTHTFERYRLTDPDGDQFHLVNVSGRPRNSFLWFGAGARRAQDIRGREIEQLIRTGWRRELLEGWKIEQLDGMFDEETEANQWAQITVRPDGPLEIEMFYLVDEGQGGYESRGKFLID
jgi:3',5'-cyclic AMP phosphodiesterase CpdA